MQFLYSSGAAEPMVPVPFTTSVWKRRLAWPLLLVAGWLLAVPGGCTPTHYRVAADRETYAILAEKMHDPRWQAPVHPVEALPGSRNYDPSPPDHPPMPPDDPAAHCYMHHLNDVPAFRHWHRYGRAPTIEWPHWSEYLELNEDSELELDMERAVELGLLHSREYQFQLEELYLTALALTLERFEFDLQWFAGNTTFFEHFGSGGEPTESNTLTTSSNLGFSRALSSGGQLIVDLANTFVWEFTGENTTSSFSNIGLSFVQPLLRGAFRQVRLEPLTQAERAVLYAARAFTRFRSVFYFGIVSGDDGYLSLLLQLQNIRNLEANLQSLRRNLLAHEALAEAGIVSPLQVDQVFQQYQAGRLALIQAENRFETALDRYKVRLGLPPELEVELDDALLGPFELSSVELVNLQDAVEALLARYRQLETAPSVQELQEGFDQMEQLQEEIVEQLEDVTLELRQWQQEPVEVEDAEQRERITVTRQRLAERLQELGPDLEATGREIQQVAAAIDPQRLEAEWQELQQLARDQASHLGDLFVLQTQIRTYLIDLPEIEMPPSEAVAYGLTNRVDLMNARGQVVDAWRRIHVTADALEADLDVFLSADIATAPGSDNPVDFSAAASAYRVGVEFDAPLNRLAERNLYRAELVNYQRARRDYIAFRDTIVQDIRQDLRRLEAEQLNFEIARQSLITAARQVELARVQLLAPGQTGDSSTTQDVLNALNSLLDAKNNLVAIWVAYETERLRLMLDTGALELGPEGSLRDDEFDPDDDFPPLERASEPEAVSAEPILTPAAGDLEESAP